MCFSLTTSYSTLILILIHSSPPPSLSFLKPRYHLSHSSSFFPAIAPPIPPPVFFLIALVPTALGLPAPIPCCLAAPASAKLSQKSFLLSSIGTSLYAPPPPDPDGFDAVPSTNRLKPSAALFAPVCAPRATVAAVRRAWAARSVSASWEGVSPFSSTF